MNALELDDPPPIFASEDEKGLIGSLLLDPGCISTVCRDLRPTDFADFALRAVYAAIVKHQKAAEGDGQALAAMVLSEIKEHPAVDDGRSLLMMIAEAVTTAAHAPTFAKSVKDAAVNRRVIDAAQTAIKAASNGQASDEVLADLLEFVETESLSSEQRNAIKSFTLGQLVEAFPRLNPPVIDGLFREGETVNVIAASKVGKSWLAYGLALSIVNNEPWLGRFDVSPGKVLLIDNELHPETLANRIPAVAEAMGIPIDTVERDLVVWTLRGNLRSLDALRAEFDRIEPGEFKVIILDAKYRFASEGVSENDNAAETLVYNLLDQYAAKTRAAFVLIHHASKGDQSGKAVTDVGSGAGAQSRATDCHMVIRPHKEDGCAVLDAAVRSFAPVQPITLRWAFPLWIADEHLDPAELAGRDGKAAQRKAEQDAANKTLLIEKLTAEAEPLSVSGVRKATAWGKARAENTLFALMAEGRVEETKGVIGHNECNVYQLVDSEGCTGSTQPAEQPSADVQGGEGYAPLKKGGVPPTPDRCTTDGPIPFPEFTQFEESA